MDGNHVARVLLPEAHDRALAELLLDLADGHLDGLEAFAVVAVFNWRHSGGAPDEMFVSGSMSGPIMRHRGDREGHGASAMGWSECILGSCRGESQAKFCAPQRVRSLEISVLRETVTFASRGWRSQILPRRSCEINREENSMPSPIGHALAGIAAGWAVAPAARERGAMLGRAAVYGLVAAAPDLDLLAGAHSGPTHGLGAAIIAGALAWLFLRSTRRANAAARRRRRGGRLRVAHAARLARHRHVAANRHHGPVALQPRVLRVAGARVPGDLATVLASGVLDRQPACPRARAADPATCGGSLDRVSKTQGPLAPLSTHRHPLHP